MNKQLILVIDAGSSGIKCLIIDETGTELLTRFKVWSYLPKNDTSFSIAFDSNKVIESISELIQESLNQPGISSSDVIAITVTSQRQSVVFLDSKNHPLYTGPNTDVRAVFEGGIIDEDLGDEIYSITGHLQSFLFAPAKLKWFKQNQPRLYRNIKSVITLADWIVYKLTGELVSEYTLASESGLINIKSRQWAYELLNKLDLPDNHHVPIQNAGTAIGKTNKKTEHLTGIHKGTTVVLSGADSQCGLLGMGITKPYKTGIVSGWSIPVITTTSFPQFDYNKNIWAGCTLSKNIWSVESTCGDAGNSYSWLINILYGHVIQSNRFSTANLEATKIPIGSYGVYSLLGPSHMNMNKIGIKRGGILLPVPVTHNNITRGHIVRSALESIAFAVRRNLEQSEQVIDQVPSDIAVSGGMTLTTLWPEILANVLGKSISLTNNPNASALGAYLCSLKGLGHFESIEAASESQLTKLHTVEANPVYSSEYSDHYAKWVSISNEMEVTEA